MLRTSILRSKVLRVVVMCLIVFFLVRLDAALARNAAVQVLAQEPPADVPTLTDALALLAAGFSGGIVSFLLERTKWFDGLSSDRKWWLTFVLTLGLPVVAQVLLLVVPPEVWAQLEPLWRALALGFVGWLGSQVTHRLDQVAVAFVGSLKEKLAGD